MYNWSVDTKILAQNPEQFKIWKLEQMINFGLGEEKINKKDLKKYFDKLYIDSSKKRYLEFLLSSK